MVTGTAAGQQKMGAQAFRVSLIPGPRAEQHQEVP
jgi:hypothetical protein